MECFISLSLPSTWWKVCMTRPRVPSRQPDKSLLYISSSHHHLPNQLSRLITPFGVSNPRCKLAKSIHSFIHSNRAQPRKFVPSRLLTDSRFPSTGRKLVYFIVRD
ncbi:hypothetical protein VTL71DRAFT_15115 [Oculimacula yallundae]|uniref:Uncharacterized protein n=1 Tax=Oculimacula yallundae TaxID=86028 RepID=A0ABR4CGY0_9HELO